MTGGALFNRSCNWSRRRRYPTITLSDVAVSRALHQVFTFRIGQASNLLHLVPEIREVRVAVDVSVCQRIDAAEGNVQGQCRLDDTGISLFDEVRYQLQEFGFNGLQARDVVLGVLARLQRVYVGQETLRRALHTEPHVCRTKIMEDELEPVDLILQEVLVDIEIELFLGSQRAAVVSPERVEHDLVHRKGLALEVLGQVIQAHVIEREGILERLPDDVLGTA